MKKIHINFAHGNGFEEKQKINSESAMTIGGFDQTIQYGASDIDDLFYEKNNRIFSQSRGWGYWLWKPYVIYKTLKDANDGDLIFYTDSGSVFIQNVEPLLDKVINDEKGLLLFELDFWTNKLVTKRDCFYYMNCDNEYYHNSIMILASFVLIKKTKFSMEFIEEWLTLSQDYRLLTDSPNECGLPNLDPFYDHRHDQSILSLLARKHDITLEFDPSQWGNNLRDISKQLIDHTR